MTHEPAILIHTQTNTDSMPFSRVGEKLHSNYNQALALEIGETRKARDDLQVAEKLFREQGNTDMVQTIQTILKRIPN